MVHSDLAGDGAPAESMAEEKPAPLLPDDVLWKILFTLPLRTLGVLAAFSRLCHSVLKERLKEVDRLRDYKPRSTSALSLLQLFWLSTLVRRFCRGLCVETGEPLDGREELAKHFHIETFLIKPNLLRCHFINMYNRPHLERVSGDGRCVAYAKLVFQDGSLVQGCLRLSWLDRAANRRRGLNFELRGVGGHGEPYLEVHPLNWAWGVDNEMLQTLLTLLVAPEDVLARVGEGHALPSAPPPPPVHLHLCPACTSAEEWGPAMASGVKVRWDQPFNLFHPEPLFHTCTCWDLPERDSSEFMYCPHILIPPCYGPW